MDLTGIRNTVFLDRYALKDKAGDPIESTPEEMWRRVARGVSDNEKGVKQKKEWEEKFYEAMTDFKFIPGGRILSGAGTGYKVTYYNCFVIPSPKDSRGGILDTLKQMVEIMARGGGVGINLSSLRPRGARVNKVNGFSSGPCNWAELFSVATKDIIQQGGTRRGALMLMLWDWHPDIEEFITVKQDLSRINGANLSVCVSDSFMEAVKKDADWNLYFPDNTDPEYDEKWDGIMAHWLALGKKPKIYKTIKAQHLWNLICEAAWRSAEPGLVFMERYNKLHANSYFNYINCVNPCGEEGLPNWGVCNLSSINLAALVNSEGEMDYNNLARIAKISVRFQDNIIDQDVYVFPGIKETQLNGERRIGLGTMGLGDALIKMKIRYGSHQSLSICEKIYRIVRDAAFESSVEIAKEKGSFPKFDANKYLQGNFIIKLPKNVREGIKKYGIRNSVLLMQAPTGSTSLMAGTSSGIEPVYEFEFIRRDRLGEHILRHPLYNAWYEEFKTKESREPTASDRPEYYVSANDLTPDDHVRVQAVIQKYVDASISKTVNAPKTHSVDDVKRLYMLAYDLGCKGVTYMREGSRAGVLERLPEKTADTKTANPAQISNGHASIPLMPQSEIKPRPMVVHGSTYKMETPVGKAYITVNSNGEGRENPFEVFVTVGKAGSDVAAMADGMGRLISLVLRMASPLSENERVKQVVHQLGGIGGSRHVGFGERRVRSLPDAIGKVLSEHLKLATGVVKTLSGQASNNGHAQANGHSHIEPASEPVVADAPYVKSPGQQPLFAHKA
ncbi:MAG: adenosylcobalamin-dependent ribonucleoside-diphosphate reductase [Patescibacteria group bacterium]